MGRDGTGAGERRDRSGRGCGTRSHAERLKMGDEWGGVVASCRTVCV